MIAFRTSNPTAMFALAAVCLVTCGVLVVAEWKRIPRLRIGAKLIASLAFLAVGIVAWRSPLTPSMFPAFGPTSFATWIVAGLALGVVGDIALLGRSDRAFLVGLGAFLLGHIAYVAAMATELDPREWLADASFLAAIPVVIALIVVVHLWPRLGSMRIPVIAYAMVIATMVIGAIALYRANPGHSLERARVFVGDATFDIQSGPYGILCAGACLFFASDLSVARDKFIGSSLTNKLWGLPAYYAGQLLIAWSLAA